MPIKDLIRMIALPIALLVILFAIDLLNLRSAYHRLVPCITSSLDERAQVIQSRSHGGERLFDSFEFQR